MPEERLAHELGFKVLDSSGAIETLPNRIPECDFRWLLWQKAVNLQSQVDRLKKEIKDSDECIKHHRLARGLD